MQIIVDSKERRDLALSLVQGIRKEDCPMQVTIEPYIENHSREQQGLWHIMVRQYAKQTGYTEPEMKEALKQEILGTITKEFRGKVIELTKSSQYDENGKLTDKQIYSLLIDETYRLAAEDGIVLE